jgi:hypothetical protein
MSTMTTFEVVQQIPAFGLFNRAYLTNQEARLADEQSGTSNLKTRGLQVDSIDLRPVRALADKVYAGLDMAESWDADWLKRVEAAA